MADLIEDARAMAEQLRSTHDNTVTAPLDDPTYQPEHPPIDGQIPAVVTKWGPPSQLRWFRRFGAELGRRKDWDRYYCQSEHHRDLCCYSCEDEGDQGTQGCGYCCCRDERTRDA